MCRFLSLVIGLFLSVGLMSCQPKSLDSSSSSSRFNPSSAMIDGQEDVSTLDPGQTYTLSWEPVASDDGVISVEVSYNSGASWLSVESGVSNNNQYEFSTINLPGTTFRLRVRGASSRRLITETADILLSGTSPLVTVNGGLLYVPAQSVLEMQWTVVDVAETITIQRALNGSSAFSDLEEEVDNDGSFAYTLPAVTTGSIQFRIYDPASGLILGRTAEIHILSDSVVTHESDEFMAGYHYQDSQSPTVVATGKLSQANFVSHGRQVIDGVEKRATSHFFDMANQLLYVGYEKKLLIYDTDGTADFVDDTLLAELNATSSISMPFDQVEHIQYEASTQTLYILGSGRPDELDDYGDNGGLLAIKTQGDADPSNDTLLGLINGSAAESTTSFGLNSNWPHLLTMIYDPTMDWVILGTNEIPSGGDATDGQVYVIDRNGTDSLADDTLVAQYSDSTAVALSGVRYSGLAFDSDSGMLFVCGGGEGAGALIGINTGKNDNGADDTRTFIVTSTPDAGNAAIVGHDSGCDDLHFDSSTGLLYVGFNSGDPTEDEAGLHVIDTGADATTYSGYSYQYQATRSNGKFSWNGEWSMRLVTGLTNANHVILTDGARILRLDTSDDSIAELASDYIGSFGGRVTYLESSQELCYLGAEGLKCVFLGGATTALGHFRSEPMSAQTFSKRYMQLQTNTSAKVGIRYRLGAEDVFDKVNFNSSGDQGAIQDLYSRNLFFNQRTLSGGQLFLKDPSFSRGGAEWLDWDGLFEAYPEGSLISHRTKADLNGVDYFVHRGFAGDLDGYGYYVSTEQNEWVSRTYPHFGSPVDHIGFFFLFTDGEFGGSDAILIDYVSVQKPDANWGAWSNVCYINCVLPEPGADDTWIQYELILEDTTDQAAPEVTAVEFFNTE